ncbi:MAG: hypothetical protein ABI747_04570 [Candidatus Moraniibacteriota bacterium]
MHDAIEAPPLSNEELSQIAWTLGNKYLRERDFKFRRARQVLYALAAVSLQGRLLILSQELSPMKDVISSRESSSSLRATAELCDDLRNVSMGALLQKGNGVKAFVSVLDALVFALEHTTNINSAGESQNILAVLSHQARQLVADKIISISRHPRYKGVA